MEMNSHFFFQVDKVRVCIKNGTNAADLTYPLESNIMLNEWIPRQRFNHA